MQIVALQLDGPQHLPRHVKQYTDVGTEMRTAIEQYAAEVRAGTFPTTKESFAMPKKALTELTERQPSKS